MVELIVPRIRREVKRWLVGMGAGARLDDHPREGQTGMLRPCEWRALGRPLTDQSLLWCLVEGARMLPGYREAAETFVVECQSGRCYKSSEWYQST